MHFMCWTHFKVASSPLILIQHDSTNWRCFRSFQNTLPPKNGAVWCCFWASCIIVQQNHRVKVVKVENVVGLRLEHWLWGGRGGPASTFTGTCTCIVRYTCGLKWNGVGWVVVRLCDRWRFMLRVPGAKNWTSTLINFAIERIVYCKCVPSTSKTNNWNTYWNQAVWILLNQCGLCKFCK